MAHQGLEDLNNLAISSGELFDGGGWFDLEVQTLGQFRRLRDRCFLIRSKRQPARRLHSQENVFRYCQVFGQIEFLINHRYPGFQGLGRAGEFLRLAVQFNRSGVRQIRPCQDFHER